ASIALMRAIGSSSSRDPIVFVDGLSMPAWIPWRNWPRLQFCRYQEYRMDRYTTLRSFVLVADCGSFAAAAHKENVTPVVMGRRLDALERHLGVKLMHRSTRGLSLTDLGEQYLERARGLLKDFDEVDASISHDRTSVRGH